MEEEGSLCYKVMPAVSNGILQGDLPYRFALPLLTLQIALVLFFTRSLAAIFKPLKQPRVLAEIIGGVLLGPTALGRNKFYLEHVFPAQSLPLLDTVATLGLMFYIFMVGLELDIQALRKTGKKSLLIGITGIASPFAGAAGVALIAQKTINQGARLAPLIVFMGVPLSITAFSVLVRIMAELKLQYTEVGRLAVASAAVNDIAVWTLLAVGVAIAGPKPNPLTPVWVLLCGAVFGIIMFTIVKMFMTMIAHRACRQEQGREAYVCITIVGVLLAGLFSDAIGVHPLLGPFLFGLVIPKDNAFPKMMTERIEDLVTGVMVPLFFASSGLKTNLGILRGASPLVFILLFFATGTVGKISATFVTARLSGLPSRKALIMGFLMNTKGFAVLIVANIGKDLKALSDETFAILVVTCLLTSFVTTPVVKALCRPETTNGAYKRCNLEFLDSKHDLRILACAFENRHCAPLMNLVESCRASTKPSLIKLYMLRLMELSDRFSASLLLHPAQHAANALPPVIHNIVVSFQASGQLSNVVVRSLTAMSGFDNMHEDICELAALKRASIIVLPYLYKPANGSTTVLEPGLQKVNQKVLDCAPCSVGILVDAASGGASPIHPCFFCYKVVILFFGGRDDREALSIGCRMANHPGVAVKVVRFVASDQLGQEEETAVIINTDDITSESNASDTRIISSEEDQQPENHLLMCTDPLDSNKEAFRDEEAIAKIKENTNSVIYEEQEVGKDAMEAMIKTLKIKAKEANLFVVGRRRSSSTSSSSQIFKGDFGIDRLQQYNSELGTIGAAILKNYASDLQSCILVVQHRHYPAHLSNFSAKLAENST